MKRSLCSVGLLFALFLGHAAAQGKPPVFSIRSGGTGANSASAARINLGAAASGANSDITSLTGLIGGAYIAKPLALSGSVFLGGNPNSVYLGLGIEQTSVSGTDSVDPFLVPYNAIYVDQDSAKLSGGANSAGVAFLIYNNFGGVNMQGSRAGIYVNSVQTSRSGNLISGFGNQYTAGAFDITGTANDNGTATTNSGALGAFSAINPICALLSGATNIFGCQTAELDIAIASGASVYKKTTLEIVKLANDAVQGVVDAAILLDDYPGAPGWKFGISFGSNQTGTQFPFASDGTLIGCAGNCGTVGNGINISNIAITGYAWQSLGAQISGVGVIDINPVGLATASSSMIVGGGDGSNEGGQIRQLNTNAGAVTPGKYMYVAQNGHWRLANSNYSTVLIDISDTGALTTPGLPTSAGSGGLYDCVDVIGAHYLKSSCP